MQRAKDVDSSLASKPQHKNQLMPLPIASPPRDDLFIDDTSDVDDDNYPYVVDFITTTAFLLLHCACCM